MPDKQISEGKPPGPDDQTPRRDDEINAYLTVLWKWRRLSLLIVTAGVLASVIISMLLPEVYRSSAVIMNTSNDQGGALNSMAGGLGLPFDFSLLERNDRGKEIQNFLESRNLKERMIKKYNLLPVLFPDKWEEEKKTWNDRYIDDPPTILDGVEALKDVYEVEFDKKTGLTTLYWQSSAPQTCVKMLSAVIDELKQYLDHEYVTKAQGTRIFVENQLRHATSDLKAWEKRVPDKNMTMSEILREREAALMVYQELRKQLELARIAEAKEMIQFKVLDEPFLPEKVYKPRRKLIVSAAFAGSILWAVFLSFFIEFIQTLREGAPAGKGLEDTRK